MKPNESPHLPFRPLGEADLASWHRLQRDHMVDSYSLDALRSELRARHAWVVGLCEGGEVIAALLAWQVVDELQIMQVVVDPRARRRGLGRALVLHAVRRARAAGAITATLEVRASNAAAIGLYTALGFAADGLRKRYYADEEDAVLMRLDLTPKA